MPYRVDDHAANGCADDHESPSAEQKHQADFPPELHGRYEQHRKWDGKEVDVGRDVEGVVDPDDLVGDCGLAYI